MKIVFMAVVAGTVLSGCASQEGMSRAFTYKPEVAAEFDMPDGGYRVLEHKTDSAVMTTPSIARSAEIGLTFFATAPTGQQHQAAARRFLDESNRADCKITSTQVVAQPQWEHFYKC